MWIIPKSIISVCAPDTLALISDSVELSEACAQSLTVRSKPSPSRTWSLKWKRDSWTQLLFGRALRTSHSESFVDWWISSLAAIHVNVSPPQESEKERTTPDTSGPGLQMVFDFVNQDCASSKMLKDTFRWDSPQSLATWKKWVTRCRGEYSARLKSAPRTSVSESSFSPREMDGWPTPRSQDSKHGSCTTYELKRDKGKDLLHVRVEREEENQEKMWPTATSRDWKDSPGMSMVSKNPDGSIRNRTDLLPRAVYALGQQGQDNSNSGGNHPESSDQSRDRYQMPNPEPQIVGESKKKRDSWPTPVVTDSIGAGNRNLEGSKAHAGSSLTDIVNGGQKSRKTDRNQGRLNARWVETIMGIPIGWTMPSCTHPVIIEPTS